jgi:hypothetical protein
VVVPNQRSKNKVYLGGFVEKQLHTKIIAGAKKSGMQDNKFGFVAELIRFAIDRHSPKKAAEPKAKASPAKGSRAKA